MPTKKLRRGLRHSKKLRGGMLSLFGIKTQEPAPAASNKSTAVKPNAPTAQTNAPLTIEEKINKINQRLDALEAKIP